MKTIDVTSSNGLLIVNAITGQVVKCDLEPDGEGIDTIEKFDLDEFRKHHGYTPETTPDSIDILDLGYWYDGGKYEEPAHDWRKMIEEMDEDE